jgi:hypothetical protein
MNFPAALGKLLEDENYRKSIESDPAQLLRDYPSLSVGELGLLISVWQACLGTFSGGDAPAEAGLEGYCCCCCSS